MARKIFPIHPANPERLCWGCDKYCAASDMLCGNGSDRTQHPYELFGEDWQSWGSDFQAPDPRPTTPTDTPLPAPLQSAGAARPYPKTKTD
jgi:hypothetical protein